MSMTIDRCVACGGLVDSDDLFCPNCGREVPDHRADETTKLNLGAKNYGCKNCGASMVYDAKVKSLKCPFCGSLDLFEDGTKGILSPEIVLPFTFHHGEAESRLKAWLGVGFWRPNDLQSAASLTELRGVLVPFWIFNANVETHWTADTNQVPFGAMAPWRPISGYRQGKYADVWIPASEGLATKELFAVYPFDATKGVPPGRADLSDTPVEQFSLARKYARPLLQSWLESGEAGAIQGEIGGSLRNVKVNVLMRDTDASAALAPVYVMAYRYRDRLYRFVLNGQSGRATGTAPVSVSKIVGAVVLLLCMIGIGVALLAR